MNRILFSLAFLAVFSSCKKDEEAIVTPPANQPRIIFTFRFDSTQQRLNEFGQPESVPSNHGAQSPVFQAMSAHYIELAPSMFTALGGGTILYHALETSIGGNPAIDFDSSTVVGQNQQFFSMPLSQMNPGTYQYLRISLAYQNYAVKVRANNLDFTGRIASFIGFRTYIRSFTPATVPVTLNANRDQGYWAFEAFNTVTQGQAPAGATTVPNPIFASSPIPQGSCVVTGAFANALTITGNETEDIHVVVSLSTNQSFEWVEHSTPGFYEPLNGDTVVDMGIRGLIPIIQ